MDVAARSAERSEDERCPYCHDALHDDLVPCPGCRTPHHQACVEEVGRCAVHGCGRPIRPVTPEQLAALIRTARDAPLAERALACARLARLLRSPGASELLDEPGSVAGQYERRAAELLDELADPPRPTYPLLVGVLLAAALALLFLATWLTIVLETGW